MNVLVYTGPGTAQSSVTHTMLTLRTHLSSSYDIIPVTPETLTKEPWQATTSLLVIPGGRDIPYTAALSPAGTSAIKSYVQRGGKYFGICAGAYFAADRVEFEVGRMGYEVVGNRDLQFLHGVARGSVSEGFVYDSEEGASVCEVELDDDLLNLGGSGDGRAKLYMNGGPYFDITAHSVSGNSTHVLARYSSTKKCAGSPAIVECTVGRGKAILSGPHIEYAPELLSRHKSDPHVARILPSLQESNATRNSLVKALLTRLGLRLNDDTEAKDATNDTLHPVLSNMHLCSAGDEGAKQVLDLRQKLADYRDSDGDVIEVNDSLDILQLHPSNIPPNSPTLTSTPFANLNISDPNTKPHKPIINISIHPLNSYPTPDTTPKFNIKQYFDNLHTKRQSTRRTCHFGSVLLYGESVNSTQTILEKNLKLASSLPSGLVCVASHQLSGRGRGKNSWISQLGCLMFTMTLHHRHAQSVIFIQYLVGLAVVETIRGLDGYGELPVHLKWPNDLYAVVDGELKKIGGILVTSSFEKGVFSLYIGCGLNIANAKPSISINELITLYNKRCNTTLAGLSVEQVLAGFVVTFETMYTEFLKPVTRDGFAFEGFLERYYKRWLHSNQSVILKEHGNVRATIVGVDKSGMLKAVVDGDGKEVLLQPDGNSFDMMKGLISRKQ